MFLDITEAVHRLVSERATLITSASRVKPVSQDTKLALAIFDCQQRYGVTTVFSFNSPNEHEVARAEVARGAFGAAESRSRRRGFSSQLYIGG